MRKGKGGQKFRLADLISTSSDLISPLNGLAGFNESSVRDVRYPNTIFRLPLRTAPSCLSENVQNTKTLQNLLESLREEAKYLLLFLKSVCKIEILHISQRGDQSMLFSVEIAPDNLARVISSRDSFMQQLRDCYSRQQYSISSVISYTTTFSVVVTDNSKTSNNQAGTSSWLIASSVGSADVTVQKAAAKQHTFPWVGTVLELGDKRTSLQGHIFCFLPMPVEKSSGLPVHVNGAFGLSDDRRSLKWPGSERKNDATANWNKILVNQLLPPCYVMLLSEAKNHLTPEQFYNAWPDANELKKSRHEFSDILQPMFILLFKLPVVWTRNAENHELMGEWIKAAKATFINESKKPPLPCIMKQVLSNCGVQLVSVPPIIWKAIECAKLKIKEVSQMSARAKLRSKPESYSTVNPVNKKEILSYCLSDRCYNDLYGIDFLPLSDGSVSSFDKQAVYLCSPECPRSLLPNLDHKLVELSDLETSLYDNLRRVALSQRTKLKILTEKEVAGLLKQALPSDWRKSSLVPMPHPQVPPTWLKTFWIWLKGKNLQLFQDQLLVPCYSSTSSSSTSFHLAPLSSAQPVVYITSTFSCSSHTDLVSALYKMNVRVCLQKEFNFVHNKISNYMKQISNVNNVVDAIATQGSYNGTDFTSEEAHSIRELLTLGPSSLSAARKEVLQNLAIFSSASNSFGRLHSVTTTASASIIKKTLGEPRNCAISISNLPADFVLLSCENDHQVKLLQTLKISFPTDYRLLNDHIFPLIQRGSFPDHLIDNLMAQVLDRFQTLNSSEHGTNLVVYLQTFSFVKTNHGRKSPSELFDPLNSDIAALYKEEDVFPLTPYNTPHRIEMLKCCGLQTTVTPQQVLDVVYSISSSSTSTPQEVDCTRFSRANAILQYFGTHTFSTQPTGYFRVPESSINHFFFDALKHLTISRSWLPVTFEKPLGYPKKLSWKGDGHSFHFVSLSTPKVVLSSSADPCADPCLVGSQAYVVTTVPLNVSSFLATDTGQFTQHVVNHFKTMLKCKAQFSPDAMDSLVHKVYKYMNGQSMSYLKRLYDLKEWIYIRTEAKFVSSSIIALKKNSTFRRDLEPFVYILPDSLSSYGHLFSSPSGVEQTVSNSQILSILSTMKDETDPRCRKTSAEDAWDIVLAILNWLTKNGTKKVTDNTYVPVESDSEWPQLERASDVVFTNSEFMRNYLQASEEKDEYIFVHDCIDTKLASALGIRPLSESLDISEDTFEDVGQTEPLVDRLVNILNEYKDGITVIKELLQNADDAEATEFNICYDARLHETDPKTLFLPGMALAHGPALIVHNNSKFTNEDFTNITKLAGATKANKKLKIGKFGIGFCSVYHMTDVPSFISRDRLFILDPTLLYLRKEISNPAQPGKKIRITSKFISGSKQLAPYDGLFGFNPHSEYQGTMFRLPFRTHPSDLSTTCYTNQTVQKLVTAIRKSASNLLLFLQHVKTITFQRINPGQNRPEVLLTIRKEYIPLSIPLSKGAEMRKLTCIENDVEKCTSCYWLVSQKSETDYQQHYYTASVACPLGSQSSCYKVDAEFQGEIFCFLPLSQLTGLPVHISSNFAVMNNRRGIWTCSSDDDTSETDVEVIWNIKLMEGVIPQAYHSILVAFKEMVKNNLLEEYTFHSLWPKMINFQQRDPWSNMLHNLYPLIAKSCLLYSDYSKHWMSVSEANFLGNGLLTLSDSDATTSTDCVVRVLQKLDVPLVVLPTEYHSMLSCNLKMMDEAAFTDLFFEHLSDFDDIFEERNVVIRRMLEIFASEHDDFTQRSYNLRSHLEDNACIPCTSDSTVFRMCTDVIDPNATFAQLFDESDSYFPIKELTERHLAMTALHKLGMMSKIIPWNLLLERAETVLLLYQTDKKKALSRVKLIINADTEGKPPNTGTTLDSIPFLPVVAMSPSPNYPLRWKGEGEHLMCGKELVRIGNAHLTAGSHVCFVSESRPDEGGCGHISDKMLRILNVRKFPTIDQVVSHFKELVDYIKHKRTLTHELLSWTTISCQTIYKFLNEQLQKSSNASINSYNSPSIIAPEVDISSLSSISCVWTGKEFVEPNVVFKKWANMSGPYIYSIPPNLANATLLIDAIGIKEELRFEDIQKALYGMKNDFQEQPVNKACKILLNDLLSPLQKMINDIPEDIDLLLPGEDFVLHSSHELSYNDAPWLPRDDQYLYINSMISRKLANKLGVKPVRSKMLGEFINPSNDFGIPFGQHEDLTQKIQNILREYPFDITILKELLQNADDSKATKMFIILDRRTHGTSSVLSEKWADLQGPALLVWNDKEFTEADLKGIQKLGLGSKRSANESIGQFGIGFNVVYHLTDCPSFITGGETMCVLDPHCKYVHGATLDKPGMRYDQLSQKGFWKKFPDMKAAFLREEIPDAPNLSRGSLFRFPLRSTEKLVTESKIINHNSSSNESHLITDVIMSRKLTEWAPKIKHALLFLNHIRELHFCEIEETSHGANFKSYKHFTTLVDETAQEKRDTLHSVISDCSEAHNVSSVIKYPLTVCEVTHHTYKKDQQKEKWLIQQGVGDVGNLCQDWKIKSVKPRHGLASPLELIKPKQPADSYYGHGHSRPFNRPSEIFSGQVFCFLPLPLHCKLPVHINGNFVLHANRRDLWHSTTPGEMDVQAEWNDSLFQAIASSYAHFLCAAQTDYVTSQSYQKYHDALKEVSRYYDVFPSAKPKDLVDPYLQLAKNVYKAFVQNNAKILSVITPELSDGQNVFTATWYPVKSGDPSTQVYFWKGLDKDKSLILESIGMKLTKAPTKIQDCINAQFDEDEDSIKNTTPETVFQYYRQFSYQVIDTGTFPCALKSTVFKTMTTFLIFLEYVLKPSDDDPSIFTFPDYPFGCPLIVTVDETLRELHQIDKVIRSKFYSVFPRSSDKFLHPVLLEVSLPEELFVCVNSTPTNGLQQLAVATENMPEFSLVKHVLSQELPRELQDSHVCTAYESLISKEKLQSIWECLVQDDTFKFFLQTLVNQFALLPTTSGSVYSTRTQIKPVYCMGSEPQRAFRYSVSPADITEAFRTMKELGLPFLDAEIIGKASITSCATLFDVDIILEYFCCLHEERDLTDHFDDKVAVILINYFKAVDFQEDLNSCTRIKSLPLFENIDGTFTCLERKIAYVWPKNLCKTGYQKWLKRYDNHVFLKPFASWTKLGTPDDLLIKKLSAEQMYTKYIFPAFSELNEKERYDHLKQIKDKLFGECNRLKAYSSMVDYHKAQAAIVFLKELIDLQCIGGDNELLNPVRHFYDHQSEVFQMFKTRYRFLPDVFRSESSSWLPFFINIGLKVNLTTDEYLDLCKAVSSGQHENPKKASEVLMKYMFSDEVRTELKWHTNVRFLHSVADIPFVCTEQQPKYEWISPAAKPCNQVKSGDKYISMTKLSEATLTNQAHLLWTVKCVVSLPSLLEDEKVLKHLKLTQTAELSLVIQNFRNICFLSKLASQKLFDQYPECLRKPENGEDFVSVMCNQLEFIDSKPKSSSDYSTLAELPCIPVYSTFDKTFKWQVVLIKPCSAVVNMCSELEFFHPFIHHLPSKLASIEFLGRIGVDKNLQINHMQIVLEAAYNISQGDELDENTKKSVVEAVKYLYKLLKKRSEPQSAQLMLNQLGEVSLESQLDPLHLPTVEHKLALSNELVYADDPNYRAGMQCLDLSDTDYQELSMESSLYGFSDTSFCALLPDSLKPVGLSQISTMHVASSCKEVDDSVVVKRLKTTFSLETLSKGCLSAVQGITHRKGIYQALETQLISFLSNMKVVSIKRLKTSVVLNTSGREIGEAKVPCFFENSAPGSSNSTLYIDSDLDSDESGDEPVMLVLSHIMLIIEKENIPDANLRVIEGLLRMLLKAQSGQKVRAILDKKGIDLEGIAMDEVEFCIGSEIPQCWMHRLDQSPDNIYHSGEKIGFEVFQGHFIFAEVLDPLLPEGCKDFENVSHIEMQYKIFTTEDDEDGRIVSVLNLYKFLRSSQPQIEEQASHSMDILPYDGETYATRRKLQREDIEDIKKELMEQLDSIWRLPEEEKHKAIKRLYLKWHPDKNPENEDVAEDIFKFLVAEIERRGHVTLPKAKWDSEAKTHGFYWKYEFDQHDRQQTSGGNWWSGGGGGGGSESQRGGGSESERRDRTYQPPFDRHDFQIKGNRVEGKRWLRQAVVDEKVLRIMFAALSSEPEIACAVCFQAHQVAEKSLKAGKFYVCGLSENALKTSKLVTHAYGLQHELGSKASDLPGLSSRLEDYSQKTRYPDQCNPTTIPATLFTSEQAANAIQDAQSILTVIQNIVI